MGKAQRKHNWKGRQNQVDRVNVGKKNELKTDTEGTSVALDCDFGPTDDADADVCNAFILPNKRKRKLSRSEDQVGPKVRKLSRKERKRLEKVLETKEKKLKRSSLLESLAALQKVKDELTDLHSTADVFSGKKRASTNNQDGTPGKKKGLRPVQLEPEPEVIENEGSSGESDTSASETEDDTNDEPVEIVTNADLDPNATTAAAKPPLAEPKLPETKPKVLSAPSVHVRVDRLDDVQKSRLKLPILGEEQVVVETIHENPVILICGDTGSGKTTQVPQFLYEAGYAIKGLIGITEPRRIAAISMSHRVAHEMNLSQDIVSYQIRYEGNVTDKTRIKFMTDGVLLKAVQKDFLLSTYSVIILDEAHERSAFTDILIGLLSRIVLLREKRGNPLKLIIMSATLRIEDFTENRNLFKTLPSVVTVGSRQFDVTKHFNKVTPENYVDDAFRKVSKIHNTLPDGGILVFLTSQQEIHVFCKRLKRTFPSKYEEKVDKKPELPKIDLDKFSIMPMDETEADEAGDEENDDIADGVEDDNNEVEEGEFATSSAPLHVLPLFSLLSSERQKKVFEPPPHGCRLCVVATNVAETSLTIPGIKYVVDCGKAKTKFYDKVTGVSTFRVTWISKASADQRAGRAGRVGPGHCYRLYSPAVFNDFDKFAEPEIVRRPVDDLILQMKELHIERITNFPFPTPPAQEAIVAAEESLIGLGALEVVPEKTGRKKLQKCRHTRITELGRTMACFPVLPCYGKMLALAHQHDLLYYAITIVAALSVQEVFLEGGESEDMEERRADHSKLMQMKSSLSGKGNSQLLGDLMVLLKIVGAFDFEGGTGEFCQQWGVRHKAMNEIRRLRQQLTNTVNSIFPEANLVLDPKHPPPTESQARLLRQIALSGAGSRVARRLPEPTGSAEEKRKLRNAYRCLSIEDPVFIHPKSVLYKTKPEYVIYQELQETKKLYMKGVSSIQAVWLPSFSPQFAHFSNPLDDPPPRFDGEKVMCHMTSTFGCWSWEIAAVSLPYPDNIDKYKWFAVFLLEGTVFKKLRKFVPLLLSKPQTMVKSWAKLQPRTDTLLRALVSRGCDSKSSLLTLWAKEPKYLLKEYKEWIPEAMHNELTSLWPPL